MHNHIRSGLGLLMFLIKHIELQKNEDITHQLGQSVQDEDVQCMGHLQAPSDLDNSNPLKQSMIYFYL